MEKKLKSLFLQFKYILLILLLLKQTFNEDKNEIKLIVNSAKNNLINISYYFFISEIIVNDNILNTNNYINSLTQVYNYVTIKFKTPLTTCINMFRNLNNILYVDAYNFKCSKVKNMYKMFSGCSSLQSLNLSNLDTSSVTNMYGMLENCRALLSIDLNNLNLTSVQDMGYMFYYCTSLTSLNINDLNIPSVTNMTYAFFYCPSLQTLNIKNVNAPSLMNISHMFSQCTGLKSLNISEIKTKSLQDMSYLFYNCTSLTFSDLNKLDTSSVIDMSYMFYYCMSLTSVNLNDINTSSVKNLGSMFFRCHSLLSLDLSNFDTSSAENMKLMFYYCNSLISLDLSNFNTKTVVTMNQMFNACLKLKYLIIDDFDTSSITDMYAMFYDCRSLISLNLSSFTINTNNIDLMFNYTNGDVELCLDVYKTYSSKFMSLVSVFKINCTDICVNLKLKKFIKEENICVDDCLATKNYKYDYNNICHKTCPLDPDLCALYDEMINVGIDLTKSSVLKMDESTDIARIKIKDSTNANEKKEDTIFSTNEKKEETIYISNEKKEYSTEYIDTTIIKINKIDNTSNNSLIEDGELNDTTKVEDNGSDKNNKTTLIIIIIVVAILVTIIVILAIYIFKNKNNNLGKRKHDEIQVVKQEEEYTSRFQNRIKIIFDTPQGNFSIYINPNEKIEKVIDMFYKKMGSGQKKLFLLSGENLNLEENQNKKVSYFMQKQYFAGNLVIVVNDLY